jgi:hypothetical protein
MNGKSNQPAGRRNFRGWLGGVRVALAAQAAEFARQDTASEPPAAQDEPANAGRLSRHVNRTEPAAAQAGGNFGRRRKFPAKIPKIFGRPLPEKAAIFGRFGGRRRAATGQ